MPPARKPSAAPFPLKASGLCTVAAGVSGSPPPTLGALMEVAARFDGLFRHHPHFRRFQHRPPKKARKPRAGAEPPKRPARPRPAAPTAFLATRIELAAAPPLTVTGLGFVAELWPRGVLDVFSNEPVEGGAALTANAGEALRHRFELTAISAGVVTLSGGAEGVQAVEADVFASRFLLDGYSDETPVEKAVGSLLIKGQFGWSGECRTHGGHPKLPANGRPGEKWPPLNWTWKELIDLTPAIRAAPLLVLLANPAG